MSIEVVTPNGVKKVRGVDVFGFEKSKYTMSNLVYYRENDNSFSTGHIIETLDPIPQYTAYSFEICCKVTGIIRSWGAARIMEFGRAVISADSANVQLGTNSDYALNSFNYDYLATSSTSSPINNLKFGDIHTYTYTTDGTVTKIYFDGELVNSVEAGALMSLQNIYVMRASTDHPIAGEWYNVRGYNKMLSADEVAANYAEDVRRYGGAV